LNCRDFGVVVVNFVLLTIETVRSATESLAQNKKLALKTEVAKSLPMILAYHVRR
jgi:hypothetical protein